MKDEAVALERVDGVTAAALGRWADGGDVQHRNGKSALGSVDSGANRRIRLRRKSSAGIIVSNRGEGESSRLPGQGRSSRNISSVVRGL